MKLLAAIIIVACVVVLVEALCSKPGESCSIGGDNCCDKDHSCQFNPARANKNNHDSCLKKTKDASLTFLEDIASEVIEW